MTELVAKQLSSLKDLSKLAHECIQDMSVFKAVTEYERSEKNRLAALLKQTESEYRNQLSYYFQYRSSVISSARDFLSDMVGYSSGGVEVSQSQLTKLESLLEPVLANEGYVSYLENKLSNSEHTIDYLSGRCENDAMQSTSCLISKLDSLDTLLTNVEWAFQEASQDIAGSLRRNTRKQINSFMNIPKGDENSSPAASPRLASTVADSALALRDSIKGVLGITEIKGSEFMAPNSINNNLGAPSLLNGMELFDLKSELSQLLDTLKPSEPHHSASSSDALWKSPALTFSAFLSNIMSKAADAKSQLDQTSQQSTLDQHLIFSLYNHPASSPQHVASATARRRASFLLPPTVSTTADGTTTTTNSLAQQPLLLSSVRRLSIPNSESHVTDNETFYTARTWRSEAAPSTAPAIVISPTLQSQQLPHRSNALRSTATNNSQRFSATADEIVNDTLSYIRSSVRKVVQLQLEEENLENQLTNVKSAIMNSETDLNTSLETAHRIEEELNNVKLERLITIEERLAPALVTLDSTVADEGSGVTQMELSYHLQLSYANDYLYKIQLLEAQLAVGRAQVAELETRVSTPYQLALPLKPKSATELGTAPSQSSIMSSGDDACTDILDGYAETGSDYEQSSDREGKQSFHIRESTKPYETISKSLIPFQPLISFSNSPRVPPNETFPTSPRLVACRLFHLQKKVFWEE